MEKEIEDPSAGGTSTDGPSKDGGKKQLLLRLSPTLWKELAAWAEDDFRSINGQIEYLLTECVRERKRGGK
jgi:hypothetical protein